MLDLIKTICKKEQVNSKSELENIIISKKPSEIAAETFIKHLIEYKQPQTGDSLVLFAARHGRLELLKLIFNEYSALIDRQVIFNRSNNDGKNALHEACQNSHLDCVRFLVETVGICINTLRKGDWTPLMLACTRDNLEIIKYLVENQADIKQVNKDGWNAFHIAVREGHPDVVKYLLEIDLTLGFETKSRNGRSPVHTAALHGKIQTLEAILDRIGPHKAELVLKSRDSCGFTPFMDALSADNLETVQFLLEKYSNVIDIYERDALENSVIHLMAQSGSSKCFELIFEKYFQTELELERLKMNVNKYKMTILHSACKNNKFEFLEIFLNRLVDRGLSKDILDDLINLKDSHDRACVDICKSARYDNCFSVLKNFLI